MRPGPSDGWREVLSGIAQAWPPDRWRDVGVVVGCSGGADSVGLMTALCGLRRRHLGAAPGPRGFLVATHLNHGLRGAESDADEAFVRRLADQHDVRFASHRLAETAVDEATMRAARLSFLTETAHRVGARYVALAHTSDDNVETALHHWMRGTGPAGLAGMAVTRPLGPDLVLVRPLLRLSRDAIRRGLVEIGQGWREDSSNANLDYRRNWIRHRLIPLIESEFPRASEAMGRAIDAQQGWRAIIERLATEWIASHQLGDNPLILRRDQPSTDPAAEQPIIIAATQKLWSREHWSRGEMTRDHWLRLANTLQNQQSERYTLPGSIDVIASGPEVHIRELKYEMRNTQSETNPK